MSSPPPLLFTWQGDSFTPAGPYWSRKADEHFVVGQRYQIEVREERSINSHRHYFAALKEAWMNLPQEAAAQFPTSEHLRKYALIKTGFCLERAVLCANEMEGKRLAAVVGSFDEFAIVAIQGRLVTIWSAMSQSNREMGKERFAASKSAVLDFAASLIGTTPEALRENAHDAA